MNRRDFLKGLSAIIPASLLAKLALPEIEAKAIEAVEELPEGNWYQNGGRVMTEKEREFKEFGGYFASASYYSEWMK